MCLVPAKERAGERGKTMEKMSERTAFWNDYAAGDWALLEEAGRRFRDFALNESCGKCVPCREGSKRMLEIFSRVDAATATEDDLTLLDTLADTILATALCGLGKMSSQMVRECLARYRGRSRPPEERERAAVALDKPHPFIHADKCKGCGKCRRGCPMEAIEGEVRQPHVIDPAKCVNCNACVSNCPFGAIGSAQEAPAAPGKGVMYIDGLRVPFDGESNILDVIRKAGIDMPTFCYHSELSVYGACRMCVVEDEQGNIEASCALAPKDGLRIRTNTARLLRSRRIILELMLAAHCRDCTTCVKSGVCQLQRLAVRFGIRNVRFADTRPSLPRDESSPAIIYDPNRCILCGDCIRICEETQGMGIWKFFGRGSELQLKPENGALLRDSDCVGCGQCAAVCPTGSIIIQDQIGEAWAALHDPKRRVVVQIAPAVRVAMGEMFGLPAGENVIHKLVAVLKIMGAELVFDTTVGADLTVMEEAEELLRRMEEGGALPMFTSCCPAWVNYVEKKAPEFLPNLSTCKSPMQMLAAVLKEHYARADEREGRRTFQLAIMPCTAKKGEAAREEFQTDGVPDVDLVLTTQELFLMIKEAGIRFAELEGEAPDMPFGLGSGAATIFGASGGVAEAVARQLLKDKSREATRELEFAGFRGGGSIRTVTLPFGERELKLAVVHGLGKVKKLLREIREGCADYDLVEVMSCRGGCVGGAGQPAALTAGKRLRAGGLYDSDRLASVKQSEFNPTVQRLYEAGLVRRAHSLLHVDYTKEKTEE